jgi:hypothetical protein
MLPTGWAKSCRKATAARPKKEKHFPPSLKRIVKALTAKVPEIDRQLMEILATPHPEKRIKRLLPLDSMCQIEHLKADVIVEMKTGEMTRKMPDGTIAATCKKIDLPCDTASLSCTHRTTLLALINLISDRSKAIRPPALLTLRLYLP